MNYRRGSHTPTIEALDRRLAEHFGREWVFRDAPAIPVGGRYPDELRDGVRRCDVLLVVMHPTWCTQRDDRGTLMIERPGDWVRQEIELALAHHRRIVPILLDDMKPPAADELPESIRDLALRQAHWVRQEHVETDVEALIRRLEPFVAPVWTPPVQPPPPLPRQPPNWLVAVLLLLAGGLLLGPAAAALPGLSRETAVWLGATGFFSVLLMCAPLLAIAAAYSARRKLMPADREMHSWHRRSFRQFALLAGTAWLTFVAVFTAATSGHWQLWLPISVAVFAVALAVGGFQLHRDERREKDDEDNWPRPLPSPLAGSGADFRRVLALFRRRERLWATPFTRDQRDRSLWFVDRVADGVRDVHARNAESRWRWLLTEHPWRAAWYLLWIAGTAGLLLAHAVGQPQLGVWVMRLVGAVLIVAVNLAALELGHRNRRWYRGDVPDGAVRELSEVAERLYLGALDRTPWGGSPAPELLRRTARGDNEAVDEVVAELRPSTDTALAATPFLAELAAARHLPPATRRRLALLLAKIVATAEHPHQATAVSRLAARLNPVDPDEAVGLVAAAAASPAPLDDHHRAALGKVPKQFRAMANEVLARETPPDAATRQADVRRIAAG
ncbi:MAG TPA: toll/interleukin-1 receptor domain-containing protein [Pseudonocardiaceae bacterium]